MKRVNKKGALELSINAIVVLILAITILGLGIAFIKGQFGSLTKQFSKVSQELETQLKDKIRESGQLLVFEVDTVRAKVGTTDSFAIGIKNTVPPAEGSSGVCFAVMIQCLSGLKDPDKCGLMGSGVVVGGQSTAPEGRPLPADADQQWFEIFKRITISQGDVFVGPVKVQVPSVQPDTYLMKVTVFRDAGNNDCGNPSGSWQFFQDKQFFVELSAR